MYVSKNIDDGEQKNLRNLSTEEHGIRELRLGSGEQKISEKNYRESYISGNIKALRNISTGKHMGNKGLQKHQVSGTCASETF